MIQTARGSRGSYRPDCGKEIAAIEARRAALAIGRDHLAMKAGISERTYRRMVKDGRGFNRHVRALRLALRSIAADVKADGGPDETGAPRLIERAAELGLRLVRAAVDEAGLSPRLRGPATLYLLVTLYNVPGAVAAAAAGCTRQNVSKILRSIEDRLDDPRFARQMAKLEERLQ